jgi:hypothetical protein
MDNVQKKTLLQIITHFRQNPLDYIFNMFKLYTLAK